MRGIRINQSNRETEYLWCVAWKCVIYMHACSDHSFCRWHCPPSRSIYQIRGYNCQALWPCNCLPPWHWLMCNVEWVSLQWDLLAPWVWWMPSMIWLLCWLGFVRHWWFFCCEVNDATLLMIYGSRSSCWIAYAAVAVVMMVVQLLMRLLHFIL